MSDEVVLIQERTYIGRRINKERSYVGRAYIIGYIIDRLYRF